MDRSSRTDRSSSMNLNNTIQPSEEEFCSVYEYGFRTWAHLYSAASNNRRLPSHCLLLQEAFPGYPCFPQIGLPDHDTQQAFVTASSLWGPKAPACEHELPSFEQQVQIGITAQRPISLSILSVVQENISYESWFNSNNDYLSILILAWTYILSARWTELMPTTCFLRYTRSHATHSNTLDDTGIELNDQGKVHVNIDYADQEEAQWWSAILSPGQGWQAKMHLGEATFLSPWSIRLETSPQFLISRPLHEYASIPPNPTSAVACKYLSRFCIRHNIIDQAQAALAAALLLPSVNNGQTLQLPPPRISRLKLSRDRRSEKAQYNYTHLIHCPDRLLTLGCNIRGVWSMLLSVFYEPQIDCNVVTPWLQGALAAIETLTGKDACLIARMCMERTPDVACLWLGVTILGLQERYLQDARRGQIPFDLHSAVWSGTMQSFMQQPVSNPLVVHSRVTRADECRLLFLSRSEAHCRIPVCQWKPFGATSVEDLDPGVRVHAGCRNHRLQFQGLRWNGADTNGAGLQPSLGQTDLKPCASQLVVHPTGEEDEVSVSYKALNQRNECISENATRSILSWLRSDGWAREEKEMSRHPWLNMDDSESEDGIDSEDRSDDGHRNSSSVMSWINKCVILEGEAEREVEAWVKAM